MGSIKPLWYLVILALLALIASPVAQLPAVGSGARENQERPPIKNGGIVTLYSLDAFAAFIGFGTGGEYGRVETNYQRYTTVADLEFGQRKKDHFHVGLTGGNFGRIIDMGTPDDIQNGYGLPDLGMNKGDLFVSLQKKDGKVQVLKLEDVEGKEGFGKTRKKSLQPIKENEYLFAEGQKGGSAEVKLAHIYVLRITDRRDKSYELIVKLQVIEFRPGESVTIRWKVL